MIKQKPEPIEPTARRKAEALRRLILMRETGPKSRAWHHARVAMIWRLHRELEHASGDTLAGDDAPDHPA